MREQQITITLEKRLITVALELPEDSKETLTGYRAPHCADEEREGYCSHKDELEAVRAELSAAREGVSNLQAEANRVNNINAEAISRKHGMLSHAFGALDMVTKGYTLFAPRSDRERQEQQTVIQIYNLLAKELNIQL